MKVHTSLSAIAFAGLLAAAPTLAAAQEVDLPTGQPVGGETYVADTYGDWDLRCIRVEEGQPEPCSLYQLLQDDEGNPVAEFTLFDLPDGEQVVAGATIVTPMETLLTPGLRLRIDDNAGSQFPFAFCQPMGCFVRLGLTAADIETMQNGGEAIVGIVPLQAPGAVVELTASLSGFTDGFAALEERNAVAQELFEALQDG
ncbi:MAG: invasion associated locus B family protein [Rhodobacteraceae bacterium]|nr:invasion associated locus B family protein [Paracoccaceae bacterium]